MFEFQTASSRGTLTILMSPQRAWYTTEPVPNESAKEIKTD